MLALLYLTLVIYLGDQICRRFFRFVSIAHRGAAAVLVGLLFSAWFTYVLGWLFARSARPLFWADLCFFVLAIGTIWFLRRRSRRRWGPYGEFIRPQPPGSAVWDWVTLGRVSRSRLLVDVRHARFQGRHHSDRQQRVERLRTEHRHHPKLRRWP